MFQTGIHIALQSLASDWLTWLMLRVTALGYHEIIAVLVIAVLFGFSLRKGFLLFQVIFWTAVLSEMAKNFFGLPRPFFADSRVACLESGWDAATPFRAMGGDSFFALPRQAVIDAYRLRGLAFGFPSGHTSSAIAVWGGLAVIFRKRTLAWLAPFMVALIAFTRLYLGVHFLADIIGGAVLGGLVLFGAWRLWLNDRRREDLFASIRGRRLTSLPGIVSVCFLFVLPLLLVLFSLASAMYAGFFIGLNAAFILASRSGLPDEGGPWWARLLRVLLGGILFWLLSLALARLLALFPAFADSGGGSFLAAGLGTFLTVWGGVKLFARLGLYRKSEGTTFSRS